MCRSLTAAADVVVPMKVRTCPCGARDEGRAEGERLWSYAFRTAAESMAVTPLRLTKAEGTP